MITKKTNNIIVKHLETLQKYIFENRTHYDFEDKNLSKSIDYFNVLIMTLKTDFPLAKSIDQKFEQTWGRTK